MTTEPHFDAVVHAPPRLQVCGLLAAVDSMDFAAVRDTVARLFARHAEGLRMSGVLEDPPLPQVNLQWRRVERYWADQIRYIY